MSEIKLKIEDPYLHAFLEFLKTLNYVQVKEVAGVALKPNGKSAPASDVLLEILPLGDPLRKAIQPLRKSVTADELIKEQGYRGTDWERLGQLAREMDIQEPIEDLLGQLTP